MNTLIKNYIFFNNIDNEKLNEKSDFLLASITKIFTIIALLIIQLQKLININDKCKKYIDNNELENVKIIDIIIMYLVLSKILNNLLILLKIMKILKKKNY